MHLGQNTEALIRKYDAIGTTRLSVGGWSNGGVKPGPPAETICPYWSNYASAFESELMRGINAHANGWPLRTLLYRFSTIQNTAELKVDGGVNLPDFASTGPPIGGSRFYVMRALPLRPIWRGFAINTVFYAVVAWLLFAGPFVVRRWRRIRRGLCPKCAYDLRGSESATCPECGAAQIDT